MVILEVVEGENRHHAWKEKSFKGMPGNHNSERMDEEVITLHFFVKSAT
jgi:hypothetical protein